MQIIQEKHNTPKFMHDTSQNFNMENRQGLIKKSQNQVQKQFAIMYQIRTPTNDLPN